VSDRVPTKTTEVYATRV